MKHLPKVLAVVGTRPEAIKMAPVITALRGRSSEVETVVVSTGQHREMLRQVFSLFRLTPDIDLDLMTPSQGLGDLTSRVVKAMEHVLANVRPRLIVVQGDTTTVFATALAAFYGHIPLAHVEAGLRSRDLQNPYPEEANRRLTGVLTAMHLAPTRHASDQLQQEGVPRSQIVITGNTVVDSLRTVLANASVGPGTLSGIPTRANRLLLVTSHRRESFGAELRNICDALKDLVALVSDLEIVYPVHLNPNVRDTVEARLDNVERIHLTPPLDYLSFVQLMTRSHIILTDSGGVQEEAPTLRKPLLVLRRVTERPEAFQAGLSKVIGTGRDAIVGEVMELLSNPAAYRAMTSGTNPYGDGRAGDRIAEAVCRWLRGERPLLAEENEFQAERALAIAS